MDHVLLKPGLENFEHCFASVWCECNCAIVWTLFGIAFLWDWNENWPFPVLWPLLFSKFAGVLNAALSQHHLSGFEIAPTGIPSPPLALFVVMLLKAHLTSHSRMSGSRLLITPLWLPGSWRPFLDSSVCFFHLFLIPLLLLVSYHFCPSLCSSLHENSLGISNFLEEISSLSHSIVFLYFFALIIEEGFLISPCYSLELNSDGYIFSFSFTFSLVSFLNCL